MGSERATTQAEPDRGGGPPTRRGPRLGLSAALLVPWLWACDDAAGPTTAGSAPPVPGGSAAPSATGSAGSSATAGLAPTAGASSSPDGGATGPADAATAAGEADAGGACPGDMVLVAGNYCPAVSQKCLEHHDEYVREQQRLQRLEKEGKKALSTVSERCLRYQAPSVCVSKERRPMRYCIDRYEWPNKKGQLPLFLVSWHDALAFCEDIGKRLCTVEEFNFACEGEDMLPYTYGYVRDDQKCAIDKPYIRREKNPKRYEACMKDEECKAEIERLDQREPAGSRPQCVSPFGVYDLNGNINEWVRRPREEPPNRSGLKSGWWGPVRCRCRPTVGFHKEHDYGYEVGFRCCQDAAD